MPVYTISFLLVTILRTDLLPGKSQWSDNPLKHQNQMVACAEKFTLLVL
jgi:hypothetical protein